MQSARGLITRVSMRHPVWWTMIHSARATPMTSSAGWQARLSITHSPHWGTVQVIFFFWLNIYNAMIIDAVIQYKSEQNMLSRPGIFRQAAYCIGGLRFSADDIEHGVLRQNRPHPLLPLRPFPPGDLRLEFKVERFDPRIHFSLVCGSRSCPPIAYYGVEHLDTQLDQAAGAFINGGAVRWEPTRRRLWLSKIFKWYAADFGGPEAVLAMIRRYSRDEGIQNLPHAGDITLRYSSYDWGINRVGSVQGLGS